MFGMQACAAVQGSMAYPHAFPVGTSQFRLSLNFVPSCSWSENIQNDVG